MAFRLSRFVRFSPCEALAPTAYKIASRRLHRSPRCKLLCEDAEAETAIGGKRHNSVRGVQERPSSFPPDLPTRAFRAMWELLAGLPRGRRRKTTSCSDRGGADYGDE